MMTNEAPNDRGLRRAMKAQPMPTLPSNFAFQTLRKVEEAARLREKRAERRTLIATILAALFLVGCCVAGLIIYFGDTLRSLTLSNPFAGVEAIRLPAFCFLLPATLPLFLCFDRWMRRQYFKRHSS